MRVVRVERYYRNGQWHDTYREVADAPDARLRLDDGTLLVERRGWLVREPVAARDGDAGGEVGV